MAASFLLQNFACVLLLEVYHVVAVHFSEKRMIRAENELPAGMPRSSAPGIRVRTQTSQNECEEVEALLGADRDMIPIWKERLRMCAGRTPLKQWLMMVVGLEYRLQIPRLAKRHLDLLVKWVREHVPHIRTLLSYGSERDHQEGFEQFEESRPIPPQTMIPVHSIRPHDGGSDNQQMQVETDGGDLFQEIGPIDDGDWANLEGLRWI
jgi:hypothetical protein